MAGRARATTGLLIAGLACSPVVAQDTNWAKDVRIDGWGDGGVTAGGDMIIFRRATPTGPAAYPQLQLRYEYREGQKMGGKTWLSMLALDEYDCKAGRFRNLRTAVFTSHNAEGEARQAPATVGPWSTPAAGTVDAKSLAMACGQ